MRPLLAGFRCHSSGEEIDGSVTIQVDDLGHSGPEHRPVHRTAEKTVYIDLDVELS